MRPANQLQLDEKELAEEVARGLTANNPAAPANVVRYSFRDRCYRAEPLIDQLLQHFQLQGCLAQRGSEEAARDAQQREAASRRATEVASRRATAAGGGAVAARPSMAGEAAACGVGAEASTSGAAADKRLRNQFVSVDRGAQTGHQPPKDRETMTEPPPTATASGSCTRWEVYDAYMEDHERQRQQEELARQRAVAARKGGAAAAQRGAGAAGGAEVGADEGSDSEA